jgi:AraC-like DNA-binding protein
MQVEGVVQKKLEQIAALLGVTPGRRWRRTRERASAGAAGFAVGYESPSQFSREYRRLFGAPPRQDVERLQMGQDYLAAA